MLTSKHLPTLSNQDLLEVDVVVQLSAVDQDHLKVDREGQWGWEG